MSLCLHNVYMLVLLSGINLFVYEEVMQTIVVILQLKVSISDCFPELHYLQTDTTDYNKCYSGTHTLIIAGST